MPQKHGHDACRHSEAIRRFVAGDVVHFRQEIGRQDQPYARQATDDVPVSGGRYQLSEVPFEVGYLFLGTQYPPGDFGDQGSLDPSGGQLAP
jgi:hypothetical protein